MFRVERTEAVDFGKDDAVRCAGIAVRECLDAKAVKVKYLGGGSFGRAAEVRLEDGRAIVVKFLRAANMLEKETHDLGLLARCCSAKVPGVLFARSGGGDIPVDCYGMEKIPGKTALFALGMLLLSRRRRQRFADEVTAALHSVHLHTSDKFGDTLHPDCNSWTDFYKPFAAEVMRVAEEYFARGRLSGKVIEAMRAAWAKFDVIFSEEPERACLIHGDLNVGNIMVGRGYRLTGFIDPLNSMYADVEYDLFQFDNLTGKRFYLRETYIEKYGASRCCMQKLAFYGLWNEVYCYIKSGVLVNLIMDPLVRNMHGRLGEL